jgi:hypothetical protein
MSGGSIWDSLECQCCFWIAGGLVPYRTMWLLTLLLFKNSIDTQGKLRLNLHSLSVSELLEYTGDSVWIGETTLNGVGDTNVYNNLHISIGDDLKPLVSQEYLKMIVILMIIFYCRSYANFLFNLGIRFCRPISLSRAIRPGFVRQLAIPKLMSGLGTRVKKCPN